MHPEAFERLRHKDTQGAIINRVQQDFNLTPILADAYFQQFFAYFEEFLELPDHEGTLKYIAVRDDQPPGKLLKDCLTVSVMLPLHAPEDLDTRAKLGLAATRQQQILRLTTAAWEQHALLTIEDLAILLCTSESTLKRDLRVLRGQGYAVPTRGYIADIGRTTTHKAMIIRLCLEHDTITPVLAQSKHSLASVERYLKAFCRMVLSLAVFLPFFRPRRVGAVLALKLALVGALQFGVMYIAYISSYRFLLAHQVAVCTIFTPLYVALVDDALEKRFRPRLVLAALMAVGGAWIVLGGLAGAIASSMTGRENGCLMNIILGIVGAVVGRRAGATAPAARS